MPNFYNDNVNDNDNFLSRRLESPTARNLTNINKIILDKICTISALKGHSF